MSPRYYSTIAMDPETDPCSVHYKKQNVVRATPLNSNKQRYRKSYRSALHQTRMGFLKSLGKALGLKTKKSFVPPYEFKGAKQPSRSRSLKMRASATRKPVRVASVKLARPAIPRRPISYRVHSYTGAGSPPSVPKNNVRFSHPVVSAEPSVTLSFPSEPYSAVESPEETTNTIRRDSGSSEISVPSTVESILDPSKETTPVRPKAIWRWSNQSVTCAGARESYNEFKSRLDGHTRRSDRLTVSDRPPSLQFITRMPTIKLDIPDDTQVGASIQDSVEVGKHRSQALSALEGVARPESCRFVLALVPKKDLPITAVQVSHEHIPSSLIPGGNLSGHAKVQGPDASKDAKQTYKAYSVPNFSDLIVPDAPPTFILQDKQTHKRFQKPEVIDTELNKRHKQHYRNVESGVFDESTVTPKRFTTPSPHSNRVSKVDTSGSTSFLLPQTPPPKTANAPKAERKPVPESKAAPTPARHTSSFPTEPLADPNKVPTRYTMNGNGYPVLNEETITHRFSAEPQYQQRFVNDVEAKFIKAENAKELKKLKSETKKLYQQATKKYLTEQDQKKLAELKALDAQLAKLVLF